MAVVALCIGSVVFCWVGIYFGARVAIKRMRAFWTEEVLGELRDLLEETKKLREDQRRDFWRARKR